MRAVFTFVKSSYHRRIAEGVDCPSRDIAFALGLPEAASQSARQSVKDEEEERREESVPEYSEITKRGKKEKKKHLRIGEY